MCEVFTAYAAKRAGNNHGASFFQGQRRARARCARAATEQPGFLTRENYNGLGKAKARRNKVESARRRRGEQACLPRNL